MLRSAIVYSGPSQLDGEPIVGIVTGIDGSTSNKKTGDLAQLWILRADLDPLDAIQTGRDSSICGGCAHRGDGTGNGRTCYVAVKNAPLTIWRAFQRGVYPSASPRIVADVLATQGRGLRLGAYGDPAALPVHILQDLTRGIPAWTGYTHQWQDRPDLRPLVMASCDTPAELEQARADGWRTFRVRTAQDLLQAREIACPASDEAGKRTTCANCTLCDGKRDTDRRADIAIVVHGIGTNTFLKMAQV